MSMFVREDEEDKIARLVDERFPSKMGFSSFNEEQRDAYRQGLEEGFKIAKWDD